MKVFVWKYVDEATTAWHNGGGLLVVANDLEAARSVLRKELPTGEEYSDIHPASNCSAFEEDPDLVLDLLGSPEPQVIVFQDAGCC